MSKIGYFYADCLMPVLINNPCATAEENSAELSISAEVCSLPSRKELFSEDLFLLSINLNHSVKNSFPRWKVPAFPELLFPAVTEQGNALQLRSSPSQYVHIP